jgi:hypothetical protein
MMAMSPRKAPRFAWMLGAVAICGAGRTAVSAVIAGRGIQ